MRDFLLADLIAHKQNSKFPPWWCTGRRVWPRRVDQETPVSLLVASVLTRCPRDP